MGLCIYIHIFMFIMILSTQRREMVVFEVSSWTILKINYLCVTRFFVL